MDTYSICQVRTLTLTLTLALILTVTLALALALNLEKALTLNTYSICQEAYEALPVAEQAA